MPKLPDFMLPSERPADEGETVIESIIDGLALHVPSFDKLPYLPSDPYGLPIDWAPGGTFYWHRVYSAACNSDMENFILLLKQVISPKVIINRCIVQAKNTPIEKEKRIEVLKCLQTALDSFQS